MAEQKMSIDKASFFFGLVAGIALLAVIILINPSLVGKGKGGDEVKGVKVTQPGDSGQPAAGGAQPTFASVPAISTDDNVRGNQNAAVTIVEYSDFECPFCLRFQSTIEQIYNEYKDKALFVYRHFPLNSLHPEAQKAAEASECAAEQGKFWEMHDKIFAANAAQTMSVEQWKKEAASLGLNASKFNDCLDGGKYASKVAQQQAGGQAAGAQGTPTTFVNGQLVNGAVPYEQVKAVIEQELAK
ncbi:MAG: thioredoxin domain-containing protein [Patescibacteria group bacterium]